MCLSNKLHYSWNPRTSLKPMIIFKTKKKKVLWFLINTWTFYHRNTTFIFLLYDATLSYGFCWCGKLIRVCTVQLQETLFTRGSSQIYEVTTYKTTCDIPASLLVYHHRTTCVKNQNSVFVVLNWMRSSFKHSLKFELV